MKSRVARVLFGAAGMAMGMFLIAIVVLVFACGPDTMEKAWNGGLFYFFFIHCIPVCAKFMK